MCGKESILQGTQAARPRRGFRKGKGKPEGAGQVQPARQAGLELEGPASDSVLCQGNGEPGRVVNKEGRGQVSGVEEGPAWRRADGRKDRCSAQAPRPEKDRHVRGSSRGEMTTAGSRPQRVLS